MEQASRLTPNEYKADGMVVWLKEGPTWPYLVPATDGIIEVKQPDVEVGTPVATIASVADTLSIQISVKEEQLSWVLVGFSILAFQPILGVFIPKDNPSNPPTGQRFFQSFERHYPRFNNLELQTSLQPQTTSEP